jgi:hypothetical protein
MAVSATMRNQRALEEACFQPGVSLATSTMLDNLIVPQTDVTILALPKLGSVWIVFYEFLFCIKRF